MKVRNLLLALLMVCGSLGAQEYHRSIGATLGSLNGLSYKYWATEGFAIQVDIGFQIIATKTGSVMVKGPDLVYNEPFVSSITYMGGQLNPNFMWQGELTDNLYLNLGGGFSADIIRSRDMKFLSDIGIPVEYQNNTAMKFGINAFLGLEYTFDAPVNLSLDFRPGYGQEYDNIAAGYKYYIGFFDWNLCLGIRYRFE